MSHYEKSVFLPDEAATLALGAQLSQYLRGRDIVLLRGGLGVGKTCFARGLIGALAGPQTIPSPTYTLVQTYTAPRFEIWHFDLYRLEAPGDVWELGLEEALENGICLIEWPERIETLLSGRELNLEFDFSKKGRSLVISGDKEWGARLANF